MNITKQNSGVCFDCTKLITIPLRVRNPITENVNITNRIVQKKKLCNHNGTDLHNLKAVHCNYYQKQFKSWREEN